VRGDQYAFIALASSAKAIIAYQIGKRHNRPNGRFYPGLAQAGAWHA
jgi:hypothetical protein